ncbi:MAG: ThuA domain-containing protein, partial [Pedobacter sp.]
MLLVAVCLGFLPVNAQNTKVKKPKFKVIAFYTGKNDKAHVSYVQEANKWFPEMAEKYNFSYDSTSNWSNMNADFLSKYQVVLFLDTRPEDQAQ